MNDDSLAIALHHGSLDVEQRRKVEAAMAAGKLRGVVCTSTLDLGIDWGDVDLVINIGAPKGASRLMQRIGRANHRLDEPRARCWCRPTASRCWSAAAAIDAIAENAQDTPPLRTGALDVLAQHVLGCACGEPFLSDELYDEVRTAGALRRSRAAGLRRRRRFRRHRRLCAEDLRALRAHQAGQGRPLARRQSAGAAELPAERRHHRRGRRC